MASDNRVMYGFVRKERTWQIDWRSGDSWDRLGEDQMVAREAGDAGFDAV
jgi:hypothetical protein